MATKRMDKTSVLRLSANFLRIHLSTWKKRRNKFVVFIHLESCIMQILFCPCRLKTEQKREAQTSTWRTRVKLVHHPFGGHRRLHAYRHLVRKSSLYFRHCGKITRTLSARLDGPVTVYDLPQWGSRAFTASFATVQSVWSERWVRRLKLW